jgi:hypothetical protein
VTHERLRGVLAPATPLAEVDGMTLMLLSVELWSGSVFHRSAAGTGTEWRAEWKFEPGPPPAATRLTVAVGDGTRACELALPAA